jgi:F-box protein 18 (helicase)
MLDEAQDANPAILGILSHQTVQRIYVRDEHQQTYGFRGTINALKELEVDKLIKGYESIPIRIGPVDATLPYTFIARTNAELIKTIVSKKSSN